MPANTHRLLGNANYTLTRDESLGQAHLGAPLTLKTYGEGGRLIFSLHRERVFRFVILAIKCA